MGVNTCFGFRFQHVVERLEPVGDVLHQQAPGIRHADAVRAVLFHQQRLFGQFSGGFICAIIRKPATSMPRLRAYSMCCFRRRLVQCVATRTDLAPAS